MTYLSKILEAKRQEISQRNGVPGPDGDCPRRSLVEALKKAPGVIAEMKRRSPSKGDLATGLDVEALATEYQQGGAKGISVLTDHTFFGGCLDDLAMARRRVDVPVLLKDFVIDEHQISEAHAYGADVVLLIVAALDSRQLSDFLQAIESLGMEALVETHNEQELDAALNAGATLIGVNARDLETFEVSLETPVRLAPLIPEEFVAVAESGIRCAADIRRLADAGYRGFLVGETLVTSGDPERMLRKLVRGLRG